MFCQKDPRVMGAPDPPPEQPHGALLILQDGLGFPNRQEPLKHTGKLGTHVHPADAVVLRRIDAAVPERLPSTAPGPPDPQHVLGEVDIISLEREGFSDSEPCSSQRQDDGIGGRHVPFSHFQEG